MTTCPFRIGNPNQNHHICHWNPGLGGGSKVYKYIPWKMIIGRCISYWNSPFFRGHVGSRRCIPFGPGSVWRIPPFLPTKNHDIQGHLTAPLTEAFQLATIDASSAGTLKVRGAQICGVISSLYQHHLRGTNMTLFGVVNDVSGHPLPFIKNPGITVPGKWSFKV